MSRPYKITTAPPHAGTKVVATDSISTKIDLPPILPPEQQGAILGQVLKEHGFDHDGESGKMTRETDGVKVEVDPADGSVTVSAEESADAPVDDENGGGGCTCADRLRRAARESARNNAAKGLQAKVTGRLERALGPLGCELEKVGNQVTGKALVQKAKTLGDIKTITHDNERGSITIVIEV